MSALAVTLGLLLAACVPLPGPQEQGPASPTREGPPSPAATTAIPAAAAAQAALASELGVPASEITVVSAEQVEWSDACLGASEEGEMCAQVITPGYRIVLEAGGKQVEIHTDASGQSVRVVTP